MERSGGYNIRGDPQSLAVRLHRTSEVAPIGVGTCAAGPPRHRGCLWTSIDGPLVHVHPGLLQGRRRGNPGAGVHPTASETGGSGPPRLNKDGP